MTNSSSARFPPEPAAARAARQFVSRTLDGRGLDDAVEVVVLLVSELVTNAILHAGTDVVVTVVEGEGALRVEVEDESPAGPARRHYAAEAVTGRGLDLVESLADRWGISARGAGKVVWFELTAGAPDGAGAGTPVDDPRLPEAGREVVVRLVGLPVPLIWAAMQYGDALLREVMLLALDGDADVGGFERWQTPALEMDPLLEPVKQALESGVDTTDVVARFPSGVSSSALRRLSLIEEANRLAVEGRLLLPAGLPEVNASRAWMLGEIVRQEEGSPPEPWFMPAPAASTTTARLGPEQRERLDRLVGAIVAADDTNHIVYVSDQAAALLGWEAESLRGQRLTVLVPPDLRAAHLGGYTRYHVTGEARLLGRSVRVPALRRDGTTVEVDLRIDVLTEAPGRLFSARLEEVVA